RWEQLDDDLGYQPGELDRAVVAPDQIRTVICTFRDKLFTEIFPGRSTVPKTLIFAKDDSHAEDIVQIVREELGKGNDFCKKLTLSSLTLSACASATRAIRAHWNKNRACRSRNCSKVWRLVCANQKRSRHSLDGSFGSRNNSNRMCALMWKS